jgi:8-oxo-dGTP diphosphatase
MQTVQQEIRPAVAAVIFNDDGHVLLQRRKDFGKWCVISGNVEFGESVAQAMYREILEEINVPSQITRLIGVYSTPSYATYQYGDRLVQYVISYFEVKLLEKPLQNLVNDETMEIRFFSVDQIPEDFDLIHPEWLQDALARNASAYVR